MKKLQFIYPLIMAFALLSCSTKEKTESTQKRPNILLLLADDMGYGELGCYGQDKIKTPVLDSLAQQGMRFTDFYAGNAVCSPSRAVLMTGKSSSYNTIRGNSGYYGDDQWMRVALKKEDITMAEMLKQAGYQTGFVGKWHLGDPNDLSTWAYNRGFDYAVQEQWSSRFGGREFDERMHWINGIQDSIFYDVKEWECLDDFRTNLAFNWLDTLNNQEPFFLFMSYRAPHGHEYTIGNNTLYQDTDWPEAERLHASKITLLDKQVGRMLTKLEEMGELDNTLIIFTSDNGAHNEGHGHSPNFFKSNGKLKGIKRDMYEGGICVPMIAYWKDHIEAASLSHHIASAQDLMLTFAQVAGTKAPEASNGVSILPALTGEEQAEHEFLNWEFQLDGWFRTMPKGGFRQSARIGNWKGVRYGIDSNIELYNLDIDIKEQNNIAAEHPEIVELMEQAFKNRSDNEAFPEGGVIQDY
ncbi:sulfatase-like hydrolase/transferase [Carboxylicivirga sediminis]|uniref:Sulfatase-like hydrolase/transferase n=1 Tax=Carboxylicivirga sediminis TaxID=2006564 RepID=A0A941F482_9BACT|nr:sulfatase-like hydrolase/transferase [Carboxylicivirga sediminis]MBR8536152.1 sulfatase-like hydrolase/transferase [Carboxylicivirga sediminis]